MCVRIDHTSRCDFEAFGEPERLSNVTGKNDVKRSINSPGFRNICNSAPHFKKI